MTMKMSRSDEDPPRRMPNQERETRWSSLVGRLTGITLEGIYEPSIALVNLCSDIFDTNVLKYVDWAECTMRGQELKGIKVDPVWKVDPVSKFLKAFDVPAAMRADWKGDHLLLKATLQRRGLALDMANLMTYETHETLIDMLFTRLVEDPPQGYNQPTIAQLHQADQEIWAQLSKKCRAGVKPSLSGVRPLETHLPAILESHRVGMILMGHKAGSGGSSGSGGGSAVRPPPKDDDDKARKLLKAKNQEMEKLKQENARLRKGAGAPPPPPGPGLKVKNKFKKEKGDKFQGPRMPEKLGGN